MSTLTEQPMGLVDRVKAAGSVLVNGKLPNPLAEEPQEKSRGALVKELQEWCKAERKFWKPVYDRIHQEQLFAAGKQWKGGEDKNPENDYLERSVYDRIQQILNRLTASLYAKNPTPEAQAREKMLYEVWDGIMESLVQAQAAIATPEAQQMMGLAAHGLQHGHELPPPPAEFVAAMKIVKDWQRGEQQKALYAKVIKTATLLLQSEWDTQTPDFLISMKQLVTRVLTSRVGYIKVMYKRDMTEPTESANQMDLVDRFASLKQKLQAMGEDDFDPDSAEAQEAKLIMQELLKDSQSQSADGTVTDEGTIIDFLGATSVIVDRNCKCLTEFIGAHRVAHEIFMTVSQCETKFGISLRNTSATMYGENGETKNADDSKYDAEQKTTQKVCVWHIEDKDAGLCYVVCDGVKDFLKEPYANEPAVTRFWSIVPVVFNVQEVDKNDPQNDSTIYPRSVVRLAMPMQIDINTAAEGLREHRVANRPTWIGDKSAFAGEAGNNDLEKLAGPRGPHTLILAESLQGGKKIEDIVQPLPKQDIDLKMYDPGPSDQAMMQSTGMQPANLGGQRPGETATGQNISQLSLQISEQSFVGVVDFALSTVAQMQWEMLIQEMPADTVKERVGPGAVWPSLNREQIQRDIYLRIQAGSTGGPNQAQEIANFKEIAPMLTEAMQAEGKSLEPIIKEGVRRLGDKLDVDEFLKPATPPPQQNQPQEKGASETISIKLSDLSPEERAQALAMAGIKAGGVPPAPKPTTAAPTGHAPPPKQTPGTVHAKPGGSMTPNPQPSGALQPPG